MFISKIKQNNRSLLGEIQRWECHFYACIIMQVCLRIFNLYFWHKCGLSQIFRAWVHSKQLFY